jgi:hypothetical protein
MLLGVNNTFKPLPLVCTTPIPLLLLPRLLTLLLVCLLAATTGLRQVTRVERVLPILRIRVEPAH